MEAAEPGTPVTSYPGGLVFYSPDGDKMGPIGVYGAERCLHYGKGGIQDAR